MKIILWAGGLALFCHSAFAQWHTQHFDVVAKAQQQQLDWREQQLATSVLAEISLTKLFEGVGVKFDGGVSRRYFEQQQDLQQVDYAANLASRVFFSRVNNLDIEFQAEQDLGFRDPIQHRFQSTDELIFEHQLERAQVAWRLGTDQSRRVLSLSAHVSSAEQYLPNAAELYNESESTEFHLESKNRISEDTFFVIQGAYQDKSNQYRDNQQDSEVQRYLAGIETKYLRNSKVMLLVGQSATVDKSTSIRDEGWSWRLRNTLKVSEDFSILLDGSKQFESSNDPAFPSTESTQVNLKTDWQASQQLLVSLSLGKAIHDFDQTTSAEEAIISGQVLWHLADYIQLQLEAKQIDLSGNREQFNVDGFHWQLGINWEVI